MKIHLKVGWCHIGVVWLSAPAEVPSSAEHSSLNAAPFVILLLAVFLLKISCPYAVTLFDNLCSDRELNFFLDEICRYTQHVFSKLAWP